MKTPWLIAVVVAAHFVAVGAIIAIQGCGTLAGPVVVEPPPEPVMPPSVVAPPEPVRPVPAAKLPEAKSWPEETTVYVVGKGESLSEIAARYGLTVKGIAALNGISNPDLIRSGQKLILPGRIDIARPPQPSTAKQRPPQAVAAVGAGDVYEVQSGDTLSEIAAAHDIKTADLMAANGLTDAKILVGQKLVIPGGARKPAAPTAKAPAKPMVKPAAPEAAPAVPEPAPAVPEAAAAAADEPAPAVAEGEGESYRIHVVEADEDLYSVAMMWGVSVARIKEVNNLSDIHLKPGQRLKIPISE